MKNERKPEIKYWNRYETLYIADCEEETDGCNDESTTSEYSSDGCNDESATSEYSSDGCNGESTTSEYSSDNPEFRKKRKNKRIKTDKRTLVVKNYIKIIKAKTKKDYRKQLLLLLTTKLNNNSKTQY